MWKLHSNVLNICSSDPCKLPEYTPHLWALWSIFTGISNMLLCKSLLAKDTCLTKLLTTWQQCPANWRNGKLRFDNETNQHHLLLHRLKRAMPCFSVILPAGKYALQCNISTNQAHNISGRMEVTHRWGRSRVIWKEYEREEVKWMVNYWHGVSFVNIWEKIILRLMAVHCEYIEQIYILP